MAGWLFENVNNPNTESLRNNNIISMSSDSGMIFPIMRHAKNIETGISGS